MSAGAASRHEAEPLYHRVFGDGDIVWLANEYRSQSKSRPSLTLERFADEYSVPVDTLRGYLPELSEGIGRSVVVWHGTSQTRARSILEEGFKPKLVKKGVAHRIFFTQNIAVARGYARSRSKGESDRPAIVVCAIDLNEYNDYENRGQGIFAFKAECISNEVVISVIGLKKQPREKPEKRKKPRVELTDVALTFNSGPASIAYWLNSCLKLSDTDRIPEDHEAVGKIREWLDDQVEDGSFGEVPHDVMLAQMGEHLPQYV